jgi:hypothetical protein
VNGVVPEYVPVLAVKVFPVFGVPVIVGGAVFDGATALAAAPEPAMTVARTRIIPESEPASATRLVGIPLNLFISVLSVSGTVRVVIDHPVLPAAGVQAVSLL